MILFFPGIIGALVVEILTNHKRTEWKQFLLITYLLSFFSYGLHWSCFKRSSFFSSLFNTNINFDIKEIIIVTIISIILSLGTSYVINKKLLYHIAIKFNLTDNYGNYDVWDVTLSRPIDKDKALWVVVRNLDTGLIYEGQLYLYSDSGDERELTLEYVNIYTDHNGEVTELDSKQFVYLDLSTVKNLSLELQEFPK